MRGYGGTFAVVLSVGIVGAAVLFRDAWWFYDWWFVSPFVMAGIAHLIAKRLASRSP